MSKHEWSKIDSIDHNIILFAYKSCTDTYKTYQTIDFKFLIFTPPIVNLWYNKYIILKIKSSGRNQ